MEEVLDVYARPYDAGYPVLCMDEQPIQLLKETRVPVPATREHPRRVDYEYERAGTASISIRRSRTTTSPRLRTRTSPRFTPFS